MTKPTERATSGYTSTAREGLVMTTRTVLAAFPPLISVPAAAKALGISRSAAYRYATSGDLPTRHLGGRVYIVTALLVDLVTTADNAGEEAA